MITLKSPREIDLMRRAGQAVAIVLHEMCEMVTPGVSTGELDKYEIGRAHV